MEKRLSAGGGIWGGGMGMNEAVVQKDAVGILREAGINHKQQGGDLYSVDTVELASGLCFKAVQSGAVVLNLMTVEDVTIVSNRVMGVVVNRSLIGEALPIDPLMFSAQVVLDATGHDAVVVESLRKRRLLKHAPERLPGEGALDATEGEAFVVERVAEIYPGLWVSGMAVCTTFGGPRMGPIFGGMLLSGRHAAEEIAKRIKKG